MHFLRFSFCNFCTRSSLTARFIEDSRTWNTKKLNLCGGFSLPISAWRRLQVVVLNSRALLAPHGTTWHHMPRALGYVSHVSQVCFNSPFCKHSKRIHKSELFGGAILFWHPWFLVRPIMAMLSPVVVLNLEVACNFKVQNDHMEPPGHDGSNQKSRVRTPPNN